MAYKIKKHFPKGRNLIVIKPFFINKKLLPKGTKGKVIKGQDVYGLVTTQFNLGKKKLQETTVVTDYSGYVKEVK